MLPPRDRLTICFAHVAYQLQERFLARQTGIASFQLRSAAELQSRIGEADVLLVSGLWRNDLLDGAGRLAFIQSISAGTDQYPALAQGTRHPAGRAQGTNERAVAEACHGADLALTRRLPEARDHQARRHWRGMISDIGAARRGWAARPSSSSDWAASAGGWPGSPRPSIFACWASGGIRRPGATAPMRWRARPPAALLPEARYRRPHPARSPRRPRA